jgi:mono/diheme cytochrome c family protein
VDFSVTSGRRETRVVAIAVGVLLMLGLPACGGGGSSSTTTGATGTTSGGDLAAGRELFVSTGCGTCHTLQKAGTNGTVGPNLDSLLVQSAEAAGAPLAEHVRTSIIDPDAWVMPQYSGGVMPTNYGSKLSDAQLDELVAFIVKSVQ